MMSYTNRDKYPQPDDRRLLERSLSSRLPRRLAAAALGVAMAAVLSADASREEEHYFDRLSHQQAMSDLPGKSFFDQMEHYGELSDMPTIKVDLYGGAQLTTIDWEGHYKQDDELVYIKPGDSLRAFINDELIHDHYLGMHHMRQSQSQEELSAFDDWVIELVQHPDIQRFAQVDNPADMTAHDLVNIAVAISASNKEYDLGARRPAGYEEYMQSWAGETPQSMTRQESKVQCELYAIGTNAVFDSLKRQFPDRMTNIYLKVAHADFGHVANMAITVTGEDEALVSIVDATSSDENPGYSRDKVGLNALMVGLMYFDMNTTDIARPGAITNRQRNELIIEHQHFFDSSDISGALSSLGVSIAFKDVGLMADDDQMEDLLREVAEEYKSGSLPIDEPWQVRDGVKVKVSAQAEE